MAKLAMNRDETKPGYEVVDFSQLAAVPCPCGASQRGFADIADYPGTIHLTEISIDAITHYHKLMTEVYFFLECAASAAMELDGEMVSVRPGMCVLIRPGTRHRAVGQMKILNIVTPKFDPADEWFD